MLRRGQMLPGYGPYEYPDERAEHWDRIRKKQEDDELRADYAWDTNKGRKMEDEMEKAKK